MRGKKKKEEEERKNVGRGNESGKKLVFSVPDGKGGEKKIGREMKLGDVVMLYGELHEGDAVAQEKLRIFVDEVDIV